MNTVTSVFLLPKARVHSSSKNLSQNILQNPNPRQYNYIVIFVRKSYIEKPASEDQYNLTIPVQQYLR